jgi:PST family polysaccharide transporter
MAVLKGLCSVALAVAGWGVWSLVWGQLIGAAAATIGLWLVMPWRPGLRASWRTVRAMLGYGSQIVSVNMLAAVVHHADLVIVGRLLGSAALGLYTLAYRTPEFFITTVIWVVGKVTFPVYSTLREDSPALRSAFVATLRYSSLVTLPAGFGLAALAGLFVSTFYGEQWAPATMTLQALAVAAAVRALGSHAGDIYKATGRPGILTKLGLLRAAVLIPAMLWAARHGILGVALAQLLVTAASTLLNLYVAGRVLSLSAWTLLRQFRTAVIACVVMVGALQALLPLLGSLPPGLGLTAGVGAGAMVYAAVSWMFGREAIKEARSLIMLSSRRP